MGAACIIVDVLAERHPTDAFYVCRLIKLITRKLLFAASNLASFKIIDFYVWRWVDLLNMCTLLTVVRLSQSIRLTVDGQRWTSAGLWCQSFNRRCWRCRYLQRSGTAACCLIMAQPSQSVQLTVDCWRQQGATSARSWYWPLKRWWGRCRCRHQ